MTIRSLPLRGLCAVIASFSLGILAQTNAAGKSLASADKNFARRAAQSGMAEIQMGKLAADKATTPSLKAFGQRMVEDHTKANEQLKSIDRRVGITPPEGINAKEQATFDSLSRLSGAAFDRAYARVILADHREDIKEFRKEANSGANPELKAFAAQTLPTLRNHLNSIRSIELNGTTEGTK